MTRFWIKSLSLALALAGAGAQAQEVDPRIAQNPALAALHDQDPARAEAALLELDSVLISEPGPAHRSTTPPDVARVLADNPTFELAHRRDPKRTLKLIEVILKN